LTDFNDFVLNIGHCNIPSLYFSISYNWKVQDSGNMDLRFGNDTSTIFKAEQPYMYLTMLTFLAKVFGTDQCI